MRIAAVVLIAAAVAFVPAASVGARKATVLDWSRAVARTPAGGYRMGNPQAKVKLVEYGSLSCPHCRAFDETGTTPLINKYVKPGKVAFEFRNYVRDPYDLAASLVARCNGAKGFFALTRALYADQPTWIARVESTPKEKRQQLATLEPDRLALQAAKIAGFQQWAAKRGLPVARTNVCLTNAKEVNLLVEMHGKANELYPDFPGTPAFVLNGKMLEPETWDTLEAELRSALGAGG